MRINNSGTYEYCRWQSKDGLTRINFSQNIKHQTPIEYFQQGMAPIRQAFLDGNMPAGCVDCSAMEKHGKTSGRERQLLKVGIRKEYFDKTLISSPLKPAFDYSNNHQGQTLEHVRDWQIDLGNYCNGACIFCNPESSSRIASEFKKIGLIDTVPAASWCDDPEQVKSFCDVLKTSKSLHYLHFIGGETVITPGFQTILQSLVDADLAKNITIGFTTNLTVWSDNVVELLKKFYQVNLGMSVETLTKINDYVRYPSQLGRTIQLLNRWVRLGKEQGWLIQLRITPTCLTIQDLTTVYDYAWQENLAVESCNFFNEPSFLRINVLTAEQRQPAKEKLEAWLNNHQIDTSQTIINTRDPNVAREQIYQDAESYLNYLNNAEDESYRWPNLIAYLKKLENSRNNSILDYLPKEYEELFRSQGY
jgi:sulfatase maturation enzyme AslB (radical SAM superfamily)